MNFTPNEATAKATWEITRFELVYFDPLHKRWQIWQEAPSKLNPLNAGNPQFYRRQFHQLLSIIRNWFEAHLRRLRVDDFQLSYLAIGDQQITFDTTPDLDLLERKDFWGTFLDHCSNNLQQNGVRAPEFLREPSLRQLQSSTLTLDANEALNLISVLPILRDWDLFGCWQKVWSSSTVGTGVFPSRKSATDSSWIEPFYIARLRRTGDLPNDGNGKPLPYEFLAQAGCCDLAFDVDPLLLPEESFFSPVYCYSPTQPETVLHYRAYAYLYDRLQESLTKKAISVKSGAAEPKSPSSYIISYPVSCVGRTHFLQIQITTPSPSLVSVDTLWSQWMDKVHPHFWTNEIKQFLSEELQRIKLSTFQSLWSRNLAEAADLNPETFVASLCSHAPILVPVRAIRFEDRRWAYRRVDWVNPAPAPDDCQCSEEYGELGVEWAKCANTVHSTQPTGVPQSIAWTMGTSPQPHTIDVTLSSRTTDTGAEVLTVGRAVQVFEQQIMVGVQAMESIKARAERVRNAARAAVHEHFMDPNARERLRTDDSYPRTLIPVPADLFGVSERPLETAFAIGWPNQKECDAAMEHFRRQTIPLYASQLIGLGPVKAMTHLSPVFWNRDWAQLRTALEARQDAIAALAVPPEHEKWMFAWKQEAAELIQGCLNACPHEGDYPDGPRPLVITDLNDRYHALRREVKQDEFSSAWNKGVDGNPPALTFEFTPLGGCRLYCPFAESPFIAKFHASIMRIGRSSHQVTGGTETFRLFFQGVAEDCPWKESQPYLSRNIVYYKYRTDETVIEGNISDGQIWKDLHEAKVREYCDVLVGSTDGFFLLHATADFGWSPILPCVLDPRVNREDSWFEMNEKNEVVVAFVFDTWRTKA